MKTTFISQKQDLKKIVLASLAATFVLAPLAAQAAPPDHAPAYGWRMRDIDEEDGYFVTLNGVVTSDLSDKSFQMRTDNGQNVRVDLSGNEPDNLRRGSRVRVYGRLNNNAVRRATVSVRGYGNYDEEDGYFVTLNGVVTSDLSDKRFEMRQGNTIYYIVLTRNEPRRLSSGDRVEVSGRVIKTNYIQADTLRILQNNDYDDNNNGNGNRINVNFPGRVLDVVNRRSLTVRGDNGTTYQVRTSFDFDSRVSTGDRVRVVGTGYSGNRNVDARRIELRDDNNNNDNYNDGDRVDFRGVVRSSSNQLFFGRVVTIDGDDGRTYKVRSGDTSLRSGDRVRVRGTLKNGFVTNVDINRL